MKILITGAAGYIGQTLVKFLEDTNYEITGLDALIYNQTPPKETINFKFHKLDIREKSKFKLYIEQNDIIIHLAALVGPVCEKYPKLSHNINVDISESIVKLVGNNQKVIYCCSNSGYGTTDGLSYCDENSPLNPISIYGKTKVGGEHWILSRNNSVSLRLATAYGYSPRQRMDLLLNDFVAKMYYLRKIEIFEPDFMRNFCSVKDISRAIVHMVENYNLTGIYNVGHPEANISKMDLVNLINNQICIDKPCDITVGNGKDPDQRNYIVSNDLILSTGFKFKYNLLDGIKEIEYLCQNNSISNIFKMTNLNFNGE